MPKRQYSNEYINFCFIKLKKKGESVPQCVVCMRTLSIVNNCINLLQRHLQTNNPRKKNRDPNYFKQLGESMKKQRLDNTGKQYQQFAGMITASYEIVLIVAKNKKPDSILEELIMFAAKM